MKNVLNQAKTFTCTDFPRSKKNIFFWKTFLMKELFLLSKTSLIKEKSFQAENFLDQKIIFSYGKTLVYGKLV